MANNAIEQCPECGSTDISHEEVQLKSWRPGVKGSAIVDLWTCDDENCGWEEEIPR